MATALLEEIRRVLGNRQLAAEERAALQDAEGALLQFLDGVAKMQAAFTRR